MTARAKLTILSCVVLRVGLAEADASAGTAPAEAGPGTGGSGDAGAGEGVTLEEEKDDLPPADVKIILLGDSAVGKSKLVERYLMDDYHPRQVCRQT